MDTLESMIDMVKDAVGDSGTCSDETAIKAINQARRALWNKATTRNNCEYFCIQCVDGCITLPSRYEKILLAWADGRPMSLSDEWYQSYNGVGLFRECDSCHLGMQEIGGDHVVFRNYTKEPYLLAVMAEAQTDEGKTVSFEVIDRYNSHHTMTLELGRSPKLIAGDRLITAVVRASKPRTDGRVRLYAINPRLQEKLLLSVFAPWDVNPSFRRFGIGKSKASKLTVFAQKKCFDLVSPQELVEYNSEAIYFALLAISARENRKPDEYLKNLSLAVQEVKKDEEFQDLNVPDPLNFRGEKVESLDRGDFFLDRYSEFGGGACVGVVPPGMKTTVITFQPPSLALGAEIDGDDLNISLSVGSGTFGAYVLYYYVNGNLVSSRAITGPGSYPVTVPVNPDWLDDDLIVSVKIESIPPLPTYTSTVATKVAIDCPFSPTGDYVFEINKNAYIDWANQGVWRCNWQASGGETHTQSGGGGDTFTSPGGAYIDVASDTDCNFASDFTPLPVTTTYFGYPTGDLVVNGGIKLTLAVRLGHVDGRYYAAVTASARATSDNSLVANTNPTSGTNQGTMILKVGGYIIPMQTRWNLAYAVYPGYVNTIVFEFDLVRNSV